MRYLVLSDIHANLEALDACLADARGRGYTRTLVLGDVVGYGADPNAVVDRVRALEPAAAVRGNHDKAACGLQQAEGFNSVARSASQWTFDALTPDRRAWLAAMPRGPIRVDSLIEICHGSPIDEDAYIFDELDAIHAFDASERPLCLVGHTHCPIAFERSPKGDAIDTLDVTGAASSGEMKIALREGCKYLVNPGAVGQPRDGDPRAAYAIVDTDERFVELFRVTYHVEAAQAKVTKAGLPDVLAQRLTVGR